MRGLSPELVKVATATTGTGTVTLGSASTGFMGVTQLVDGRQYVYTINDSNDKEVGLGVYTASGTTLTRATVIRSVISASEGTTKITLSGTATVQFGSSGYDHASYFMLGYGGITGLHPVWTDATHIGCSPGAAYIESLDRAIFAAPADIAPSLANDTWYHVYLKTDGTLEAPTTAPVAFATAIGSAFSKTADTTRRYLYSFRTNGSAQIRRFVYNSTTGVVQYIDTTNATPYRVADNLTSTTAAAVDCSAVVPVTARALFGQPYNVDVTTKNLFISPGDVTPTSSVFVYTLGNGQTLVGPIPCDSAQTIKYIWSGAPTGGFYLDVYGYYLRR